MSSEREEFIEVVFVARVKIRIPDNHPDYDHNDAGVYLEHALCEGIDLELPASMGDKVLESITFMSGEFEDAIKERWELLKGVGL